MQETVMLFNIPSLQMPNLDLEGVMRQLIETGKRTQQLWLTADSMAFVARGREYPAIRRQPELRDPDIRFAVI